MKKPYTLLHRAPGVRNLIIAMLMLMAGAAVAQTTTVPYNSGTGQFDVPQGVTEITVEVWGAGGRGGTRSSDGSSGGGGGGAYSSSVLSVTPGQQLDYSVGTGSSSTSPGGDTWFGSNTTVMAKGGASVGANSNTSGVGGAATSGYGTVKLSGGNGAIGPTNYGGGGASSASNTSNGNYTNTTTQTYDAATITGGGNGGRGSYVGGLLGSGNYLGDAGVAPGGGGGGGSRRTAVFIGALTQPPGNGANGRVVITYCTPPVITTQPVAATETYGSNATFTIATSATNVSTYQWQVNSGSGWTNTGTNSASLIVTLPTVAMSGYQYRCIITVDCGSFTVSNAVGLTVNAKALTINATAQNKVYGQTLTSGTGYTQFTSSGLVGSETIGSVTVAYTGGNTAGAPVGTYPNAITISNATGGTFTASNYSITYVPGNLTVTALTVNVTADAKSKTYGDSDPSLTYQYAPALIGSDAFTGSLTRVSGESVGTYAIQQGSLALSTNYVLNYTGALLTINHRAITITAASNSKVYDGTALTDAGYSITAGTLATGHTLSAVTVTGTQTTVGTSANVASAAVILGSTDVTANYALTYVAGTLGVTARPLEITASSTSKTYGETHTFANTEYTLTNSTSLGSSQTLTLVLSSTGAPAAAAVGPYDITIGSVAIVDGSSNNVTSNYSLTTVNGTLTVGTRALTVTSAGINKVYDATATATVTLSDDRVTGDDLTVSYTSASFADKHVGTGKTVSVSGISISGTDAGNYTLANTTASTTADITKAPVTVTAQTDTKVYDGTSTSSVSPLVAGIISPDAVGTAPVQTFDNANVGTGKTLSASGLVINDGNSGGNYEVSYVSNNTGSITARTLTVTATGVNKVYDGTAFTAFTSTITGFVNGETESVITGLPVTYTGDATTAVNAGTYTITPVITELSADNYSFAAANGTLTISKAPLSITADDQAKCFGIAFTFDGDEFTSAGLQNGETIGSVTLTSDGASAAATAGTFAIVPTVATGGTFNPANYTITYNNGTMTVYGLPSFTFTVTDQSCFENCDGTITITATGGSGSYEYSNDGGATWQPENVFSGLCAGEYEIMVKDSYGCEQPDGTLNP